ncbi:hypothetical protein ADUPG1_008120 [Aduncisulcus paluster]|uniref:Uncharacterized protein n=1 Tax=Aduncisulcus paluster TaxID=2918883 RepID=A0ABQ5KTA6_9EUKA|nr:hypothetical protein ADUPG1_008120 [Aduncisulcus paluster]
MDRAKRAKIIVLGSMDDIKYFDLSSWIKRCTGKSIPFSRTYMVKSLPFLKLEFNSFPHQLIFTFASDLKKNGIILSKAKFDIILYYIDITTIRFDMTKFHQIFPSKTVSYLISHNIPIFFIFSHPITSQTYDKTVNIGKMIAEFSHIVESSLVSSGISRIYHEYLFSNACISSGCHSFSANRTIQQHGFNMDKNDIILHVLRWYFTPSASLSKSINLQSNHSSDLEDISSVYGKRRYHTSSFDPITSEKSPQISLLMDDFSPSIFGDRISSLLETSQQIWTGIGSRITTSNISFDSASLISPLSPFFYSDSLTFDHFYQRCEERGGEEESSFSVSDDHRDITGSHDITRNTLHSPQRKERNNNILDHTSSFSSFSPSSYSSSSKPCLIHDITTIFDYSKTTARPSSSRSFDKSRKKFIPFNSSHTISSISRPTSSVHRPTSSVHVQTEPTYLSELSELSSGRNSYRSIDYLIKSLNMAPSVTFIHDKQTSHDGRATLYEGKPFRPLTSHFRQSSTMFSDGNSHQISCECKDSGPHDSFQYYPGSSSSLLSQYYGRKGVMSQFQITLAHVAKHLPPDSQAKLFLSCKNSMLCFMRLSSEKYLRTCFEIDLDGIIAPSHYMHKGEGETISNKGDSKESCLQTQSKVKQQGESECSDPISPVVLPHSYLKIVIKSITSQDIRPDQYTAIVTFIVSKMKRFCMLSLKSLDISIPKFFPLELSERILRVFTMTLMPLQLYIQAPATPGLSQLMMGRLAVLDVGKVAIERFGSVLQYPPCTCSRNSSELLRKRKQVGEKKDIEKELDGNEVESICQENVVISHLKSIFDNDKCLFLGLEKIIVDEIIFLPIQPHSPSPSSPTVLPSSESSDIASLIRFFEALSMYPCLSEISINRVTFIADTTTIHRNPSDFKTVGECFFPEEIPCHASQALSKPSLQKHSILIPSVNGVGDKTIISSSSSVGESEREKNNVQLQNVDTDDSKTSQKKKTKQQPVDQKTSKVSSEASLDQHSSPPPLQPQSLYKRNMGITPSFTPQIGCKKILIGGNRDHCAFKSSSLNTLILLGSICQIFPKIEEIKLNIGLSSNNLTRDSRYISLLSLISIVRSIRPVHSLKKLFLSSSLDFFSISFALSHFAPKIATLSLTCYLPHYPMLAHVLASSTSRKVSEATKSSSLTKSRTRSMFPSNQGISKDPQPKKHQTLEESNDWIVKALNQGVSLPFLTSLFLHIPSQYVPSLLLDSSSNLGILQCQNLKNFTFIVGSGQHYSVRLFSRAQSLMKLNGEEWNSALQDETKPIPIKLQEIIASIDQLGSDPQRSKWMENVSKLSKKDSKKREKDAFEEHDDEENDQEYQDERSSSCSSSESEQSEFQPSGSEGDEYSSSASSSHVSQKDEEEEKESSAEQSSSSSSESHSSSTKEITDPKHSVSTRISLVENDHDIPSKFFSHLKESNIAHVLHSNMHHKWWIIDENEKQKTQKHRIEGFYSFDKEVMNANVMGILDSLLQIRDISHLRSITLHIPTFSSCIPILEQMRKKMCHLNIYFSKLGRGVLRIPTFPTLSSLSIMCQNCDIPRELVECFVYSSPVLSHFSMLFSGIQDAFSSSFLLSDSPNPSREAFSKHGYPASVAINTKTLLDDIEGSSSAFEERRKSGIVTHNLLIDILGVGSFGKLIAEKICRLITSKLNHSGYSRIHFIRKSQ